MDAISKLEEKYREKEALSVLQKKYKQEEINFSRNIDKCSLALDQCLSFNEKIKEKQNDIKHELEIQERNLQKSSDLKAEIEKSKQAGMAQIKQNQVLEEKLKQYELALQEQKIKAKEVDNEQGELEEQIMTRIKLYSKTLGLQITTTHRKTFVLKFTQINRNDPNEEYLLELCVDKNSYCLKRCCPAIENLQRLETTFNSDDDIVSFLLEVRNEFVKIASDS